MKRILIGAIAALLLAGAGAVYVARDQIGLNLFRAGMDRAMSADLISTLPDGLTAAFCGTGSPMPDIGRAGPCLAVVAGDRLFVFDAGEGASETLAIMGLPPARIEAVFLTHFHSDHIDGLGNLALQRWAMGAARAPLPLYGPEGVERIASGFNEAYAIDAGHRVAHHGEETVPRAGFGYAAHPFVLQDTVVAYDHDGVRITAIRVDHGPISEAVGYRVDYRGRSIVISGDTGPSLRLTAASHGVDLLIHEALAPELVAVIEETARERGQAGLAKIFHDIPDYHTAPEVAADIASTADVGALALTHLVPIAPFGFLEGPFLHDARQRFDGPLWITRDGDLITLPATGGMNRRRAL